MVMPLTGGDAGALEDPSVVVVMDEMGGAPLSVDGTVGPCGCGGISSTENDVKAVICIEVDGVLVGGKDDFVGWDE